LKGIQTDVNVMQSSQIVHVLN